MAHILSVDNQIDYTAERIRARLQQEGMTSLQRVISMFTGQVPDRMPLFLILDEEWCAHYLGYQINEDFASDPKKLALAALVGCDRLKSDFCDAFLDCYVVGPDAMGAKVYFPEDSMPEIIDPPVKSPADLTKLKIPDPYRDGRMPVQLETVRICQEKVGDVVSVLASICGPFSWAANLRGIYNYLADLKRNPKFAHDLLDICTEACKEMIKSYRSIGVTPFLADATASTYLISPGQLEEYSIASYAKLMADLGPDAFMAMTWSEWDVQARGCDMLPVLRTFGINNYRYCQSDAGAVEAEVLEGKRVAQQYKAPYSSSLWGRWVAGHSPLEIDAEVKRVIGLAGPEWPFYVGLWSVPVDCPITNVDAYLRAAIKYGTFAPSAQPAPAPAA